VLDTSGDPEETPLDDRNELYGAGVLATGELDDA
jgi:hypothetical protein